MTDNHVKLFERSEIEYITPFLKLWMSFNNYYKTDLGLTSDRQAINSYKEDGKLLQDRFLELLDTRSEEAVVFQDALFGLMVNLSNVVFSSAVFDQGRPFPNDLVLENPDGRTYPNHTFFISQTHKRFYIQPEDKGRLFKYVLEIIYQVRCRVVHGDFDLDDIYFIRLIENSYRILHPMMKRVIENVSD